MDSGVSNRDLVRSGIFLTTFCVVLGPPLGFVGFMSGIGIYVQSLPGAHAMPPIYVVIGQILGGIFMAMPVIYLVGGLQAFIVGLGFSYLTEKFGRIPKWAPIPLSLIGNALFMGVALVILEVDPYDNIGGRSLLFLMLVGTSIFSAYCCLLLLQLIFRGRN